MELCSFNCVALFSFVLLETDEEIWRNTQIRIRLINELSIAVKEVVLFSWIAAGHHKL